MESIRYFETSGKFQQITRRYIAEYDTLYVIRLSFHNFRTNYFKGNLFEYAYSKFIIKYNTGLYK
jgi:hypothetical protein